ncbi:MAG: hypothetical protein CMO55_05500 [Verrucomicrobiales bacterium]|nr:hypothetical protein [Verrucomicrobiales bacterium]
MLYILLASIFQEKVSFVSFQFFSEILTRPQCQKGALENSHIGITYFLAIPAFVSTPSSIPRSILIRIDKFMLFC